VDPENDARKSTQAQFFQFGRSGIGTQLTEKLSLAPFRRQWSHWLSRDSTKGCIVKISLLGSLPPCCTPCLPRWIRKTRDANVAKRVSTLAIVLLMQLALSSAASAQQKYPVKPIRVVVAFSAGGTSDVLARMITQGMSEAWGQPMVIEPRPGAGGTLAATIVSKAAPDGYTLLATSGSFPISAVTGANLPYDPLKDFATVGEIGYGTQVIVVSPSLGVKTVKDFVAYANARPGKLLFGSTGALTSTHLSTERFRSAVGIRAQHVGFKGQVEYVIEIVADRVHFGAPGLIVALPLIKDGKLVPLVVATPQRSPLLPDVPTASEAAPGWGRDGSQAWLAPAGTPRVIRQQISREMARNLALPDVKARLQSMGFFIAPTSPEEHEKNLRADIEIFSRLVKELGLTAK
jgi:tripartite-type tricarboxylate transporter receptor subunit TctC